MGFRTIFEVATCRSNLLCLLSKLIGRVWQIASRSVYKSVLNCNASYYSDLLLRFGSKTSKATKEIERVINLCWWAANCSQGLPLHRIFIEAYQSTHFIKVKKELIC